MTSSTWALVPVSPGLLVGGGLSPGVPSLPPAVPGGRVNSSPVTTSMTMKMLTNVMFCVITVIDVGFHHGHVGPVYLASGTCAGGGVSGLPQ